MHPATPRHLWWGWVSYDCVNTHIRAWAHVTVRTRLGTWDAAAHDLNGYSNPTCLGCKAMPPPPRDKDGVARLQDHRL
jgi:hypothetical protein